MHLQEVPYSNRNQFIDLSEKHQKLAEEVSLQQIWATVGHKVLSEWHPLTGII